VQLVECAEWARGPGASLRCGLDALGAHVEAAVVVLADGPLIAPDAVRRVLEAWRAEGGVVAASYGGERGHPLVLGRDAWDDVPDGGLHERPVRLVPCDDLGPPGDVDTPADLPQELT
jgi:nicotine blue oxidoreductase